MCGQCGRVLTTVFPEYIFQPPQKKKKTSHQIRIMCYVIITSVSLVWFLCTLVADMLVAVALVTPKWLIGPGQLGNWSQATPIAAAAAGQRLASVGIYTRCKQMQQLGYHCGRFDLDGFATDGSVYPLEWKVAMFFMSLGLVLLSLTVAATLLTCCRQSAFGKSIHNMTACAQVLAGKLPPALYL